MLFYIVSARNCSKISITPSKFPEIHTIFNFTYVVSDNFEQHHSCKIETDRGNYKIVNVRDKSGDAAVLNIYGSEMSKVVTGNVFMMTNLKKTLMKDNNIRLKATR